MPESDLYFDVLDRLYQDAPALGDAAQLVEAAMTSDEALAAAFSAVLPASTGAVSPQPDRLAKPLRGIWLTKLGVRGFRGIGPELALELDPEPGLVLITGRNGSGKSSLAEALEVLLTGDSARFRGRSKDWQNGWRNLAGEAPQVRGRFAVEGEGSVVLERTWPAEGELRDAIGTVRREGSLAADLASVGWSNDIVTFRPLLATTELARMHDEGPSAAYDALKGILGLDELVTAMDRLSNARKEAKRLTDENKGEIADVKQALEGVLDPRAEAARAILATKKPDLDALSRIVDGADRAGDPELDGLRRASLVELPNLEDARLATRLLRELVAQAKAAAQSAVEVDRRAADVLSAALAWHDAHGDGDCPVCGAKDAADLGWLARATALRDQRREAAKSGSDLQRKILDAERLVRRFDTECELLGDALADHVDAALPKRIEGMKATKDAAVAAMAQREDRWKPLALRIQTWIHSSRAATTGKERQQRIERAEKWLKDLSNQMRAARFKPLAEEAQAIWSLLKQESSVDLVRVALVGTGKQRKVDLGVSIDGADSVALSVMSQGELNALALALFLPRAMLSASPFRFVVIDDPVQSMDPGKVDGLARVLGDVAKARQVVVFTHDPRLVEAVRRLQIRARIVSCGRRGSSVVELRDVKHPTEQNLLDAEEIARGAGLGAKVGRRVVPGLCRAAVEATLQSHVRRSRLGRGDRHEDVEHAIHKAHTLHQIAALAMFDTDQRGGDVLPILNRVSSRAADAFQALKHGSHEAYPHDLLALVDDTRHLVSALPRVMS